MIFTQFLSESKFSSADRDPQGNLRDGTGPEDEDGLLHLANSPASAATGRIQTRDFIRLGLVFGVLGPDVARLWIAVIALWVSG